MWKTTRTNLESMILNLFDREQISRDDLSEVKPEECEDWFRGMCEGVKESQASLCEYRKYLMQVMAADPQADEYEVMHDNEWMEYWKKIGGKARCQSLDQQE